MKNYLLTKTASVFSSKKFLTALIFIFLPFVAMAQAASDVVQPPKEFDPSGWNWVSICYIVLAVLILLIIARVFDIGSLTEKVTGRKVINWDKANGWIAILFLVGGCNWCLIYRCKCHINEKGGT